MWILLPGAFLPKTDEGTMLGIAMAAAEAARLFFMNVLRFMKGFALFRNILDYRRYFNNKCLLFRDTI
jgi:hypothetical protein